MLVSGCGPDADPRPVVPAEPPARPVGVEDAAWADVRARFILEPGVAYMNNASLGMPPAVVAQAVGAGYRAISEEPLHGKHDLQEAIRDRVVPGLAAMLGAEPDELSLTRNATEALHNQTLGLALEPGDQVLITTQEHPAGRRPWMFRAAHDGTDVTEVFIPSPFENGAQVVERFEQAITPKTRAIAFCHVTRGGHLYPVRSLAELARERGLVSLVDGAQAVGMFPIDLADLGCDAYSASLHKWLLGPVGTGVMYVRTDARDRIRSVFEPQPTAEVPGLAPTGTEDFPVRAALEAALAFADALGLDAVAARTRYLSDTLKRGLADIPGCTPLSGPGPEVSCPGSTIFEIAGVDAVALVPFMEREYGIHLDEHQRDGHNAIRISTHIYNTTSEIDRALEGLEVVARSGLPPLSG
jgi:selenocysteine lyase/cysteine desulfurase